MFVDLIVTQAYTPPRVLSQNFTAFLVSIFFAMTPNVFADPTPTPSPASVYEPILLPHHSPLSPLELMANDKEAESIIIGAKQLRAAQNQLGDLPALRSKLEVIAAELAPRIFDHPNEACELNVLGELRTFATRQGFETASESDLRAVLVALRDANLVDDVVLAPLWKSVSAFVHTPQVPAVSISGQAVDISALDRTKKLFYGVASLCPSQASLAVAQRLRAELKNKYKSKYLPQEAHTAFQHGDISGELDAWLTDLENEGYQDVGYTLASIAQTLKQVKNVYLIEGQKSNRSEFSSRKKKKSHGLSYRLAFYKKYGRPEQIERLNEAYHQFNLNSTAAEVRIDIDYAGNRSNVKAEPLSKTEQLRWAKRRLHVEYASVMAKSDDFEGLTVDYEDVLLAAIEMGYLPADFVDTALKFDDLWTTEPETGFRKVMTIFKKYGSPLLVLVPAPFNMFASVTLILADTTLLKKKDKADPLKAGYSIF